MNHTLKTLIIAFAVVLFLSAPSVDAQAADAAETYRRALVDLIALLQQQVLSLQAQLALLTAPMPVQQLGAIDTSPEPVPTPRAEPEPAGLLVEQPSPDILLLTNEATSTVRIARLELEGTEIMGFRFSGGGVEYAATFTLGMRTFNTFECRGIKSLGTVSTYGNRHFDPCARRENVRQVRNELEPGEAMRVRAGGPIASVDYQAEYVR